MFSSARMGEPAATWPTSGSPFGRTTDLTASVARSSSSSARGLDGSRRRRPTFSRFDRCACTVEDDARPTALPMPRTVRGEPYLAEYFLMKSKISCWRLVRSMVGPLLTSRDERSGGTCVRQGSEARGRIQDAPVAILPSALAPVAELVDAQG